MDALTLPELDDLPEDLSREPDPPSEPKLDWPEWLAYQAAIIRMQGGTAAAWLAGYIDHAAGVARMLHAQSPEEHDERLRLLQDTDLPDSGPWSS